MSNPVMHFEIMVKDLKKGQKFYSDLFNWKTRLEEQMNYVLVEKEGNGIGGGIGQAEAGKFPPYVTFYIAVDDLQNMVKKVNQLGGSTVAPPTPIPGVGQFALVNDPDGNMIGLIQPDSNMPV